MLAVSNTSPILNLAILRRLDLLRQELGELLIPGAVHRELRVEAELPGSCEMREALAGGWLKVQEVKDPAMVRVLAIPLHRGEAEAIALGLETGARWVLLDERDATQVAHQLGLATAGVLGVLLAAKRQGRVEAMKPLIEALDRDAGFFLSDRIRVRVLAEAGERKLQLESTVKLS